MCVQKVAVLCPPQGASVYRNRICVESEHFVHHMPLVKQLLESSRSPALGSALLLHHTKLLGYRLMPHVQPKANWQLPGQIILLSCTGISTVLLRIREGKQFSQNEILDKAEKLSFSHTHTCARSYAEPVAPSLGFHCRYKPTVMPAPAPAA